MEIKKVFSEIEYLKSEIGAIDHLLAMVNTLGLKLQVTAINNYTYRGVADQAVLIEALKSKRNEMQESLDKLTEAVNVAEKVIDGLIS